MYCFDKIAHMRKILFHQQEVLVSEQHHQVHCHYWKSGQPQNELKASVAMLANKEGI